jgi:hypothetical protein
MQIVQSMGEEGAPQGPQRWTERNMHKGLVAVVATLLFIFLVPSFFIHLMSTHLPRGYETDSDLTSSKPRAAIVDQLSLTFPNETFRTYATNTLEHAGYEVDYYPGENVTVEFFRTLATHRHKQVILRVHSTAVMLADNAFYNAPVAIFTSEEYRQNQYIFEQLTGQIVSASYPVPRSLSYFALTPEFIRSSMRGMFNNTIVIMMGCEGLNNTHMAEAFVERGAGVYIGWDKSPQATDTDSVTSYLLEYLLIQKETLDTAVQAAMDRMMCNIQNQQLHLLYYPQNIGEQRIEEILKD